VLYQCFPPEEFKYGLRILQQSPESHDDAFFQYFWEVRDAAVDALVHVNRTLTLVPRGDVHQLPFLELLVHLHSKPKTFNNRSVGRPPADCLNAGSNANAGLDVCGLFAQPRDPANAPDPESGA
jgi:hypothetical protein